MTGLLTTVREVLFLAGLIGLALVLLYLLRPRRRRVEVPFGALWQRVLVQSESRAVGKHWRRLLSLLLMAAIAGLLVTALADPLLTRAVGAVTAGSSYTVLILDTSASMGTRDGRGGRLGPKVAGTRLDEALGAVAELVGKAPSSDRFLLLSATGHVQVRSGWGAPRPTLLQALDGVQTSSGGLDLQRALAAADQALAGRPRTRTVLITDGGPALVAPAKWPSTLQVLRVGPARGHSGAKGEPTLLPQGLDNLAVADVRVRPAAGDPGRGTATVTLRNDARRPVQARLSIAASDRAQDAQQFGQDAALRRVTTLTVLPGTSRQVLEDVDLSAARLAVRIAPEPPPPGKAPEFVDLAPYDDWGFAVLAERHELHVLLVTEGNLFLEAALLASDRVRLHAILPSGYKPENYAWKERVRHGIDVVVLDQLTQPLPDGMPGLRLLLHSEDPKARYAQAPEVVVRAADHALMRGVSFQDTNFDQIRVIAPQPGDVVLAAALPSAPVMVARAAPVRTVEWGLDLLETDLGGRFAMPILMDDAVAWLAGEEEPLLAPLELGRPWAIEAAGVGPGWKHLEPGQKEPKPARTSAGQLLAASETHGVHVWLSPDGREVARATVLPPAESPSEIKVLGRAPPGVDASEGSDPTPPKPRWTWLLLAATVVLAAEFGLYLRRRTV